MHHDCLTSRPPPARSGAAQFVLSRHQPRFTALWRSLPRSASLSRAQPRSVLSRHQPRCTALWRSLLRSASLSRAQSRSVALSRAQPCSDVLGMKSGLFGAEPCTAAPPHDCAPLSRIQRRDRALFPRFASYLHIMPGVGTVPLHNFGRVFCYCGSIAVLLRNTSASSPS